MKKQNKSNKKTINSIAMLSTILAILVISKYALGFIPGFEIITFSFIIIGLYLKISELAMLVTSFWLLVNVVYGFNIVFIPYLWIFFIDGVLSKIIYKTTKSKYIWASTMAIAPILLTSSYFFYDWVIFDYGYATTRILTALPVLLISIITTGLTIIIVGPYITNLFNRYFKNNYFLKFGSKNGRRAIMITSITLGFVSILGVYKLQDIIYDKISNSEKPIEIVKDEYNNDINPRLYSKEEFNIAIENMGIRDIKVRFIFNDNDDLDGVAKYFEIDYIDSLIDGKRVFLGDLLRETNNDNNDWNFNFKDSSLGTSFRNFSHKGVWYGKDTYCGFSFANHNRSGTGIDGIIIKSKYIYTFDYHYKDPLYNGYCRY